MGKIRILVVVAACAVLSNLSFGMYNPEMGRFMQRDPIGTAVDATHTKQGSLVVSARATIQPNTASASSPSTQTKEHTSGLNLKSQQLRKQQLIGLNVYDQYKDGMSLYQYCQSDPVNKIDPWGLECGVVVKRFVVRDSSWIDMGHEWLSTGSGSIGFWPNGAGIPGREWSVFSPDPGESSSKAPDIVWDTNRDNGWFNEKKLKWGTGAGKKCCAATCSDITSCVLSSPDPGWRNNAIFNNCRKFVDVTLKGCCLSKGKRI